MYKKIKTQKVFEYELGLYQIKNCEHDKIDEYEIILTVFNYRNILWVGSLEPEIVFDKFVKLYEDIL